MGQALCSVLGLNSESDRNDFCPFGCHSVVGNEKDQLAGKYETTDGASGAPQTGWEGPPWEGVSFRAALELQVSSGSALLEPHQSATTHSFTHSCTGSSFIEGLCSLLVLRLCTKHWETLITEAPVTPSFTELTGSSMKLYRAEL